LLEEEKEANDVELFQLRSELEVVKAKQMADQEIFEDRLKENSMKTILLQGQLAAYEEHNQQVKQEHEEQLKKMELEKQEAIAKLKQEMQGLQDDKNELQDQKYALEETI
jgi:hypothetical protein